VSISEQLDVLREQLVEERMQRQVAEFPIDFVGGLVSSDLSRGEHQTPERLSRGLGGGLLGNLQSQQVRLCYWLLQV